MGYNDETARNRTYSGCWTCRSRKIKCDQQKPQCKRCLKANLKCEGYNIRLTWCDLAKYDIYGDLIESADDKKAVHQRNHISFAKYNNNTVDLSEIDDNLSYLDDSDPNEIRGVRFLQQGPFRLFTYANINSLDRHNLSGIEKLNHHKVYKSTISRDSSLTPIKTTSPLPLRSSPLIRHAHTPTQSLIQEQLSQTPNLIKNDNFHENLIKSITSSVKKTQNNRNINESHNHHSLDEDDINPSQGIDSDTNLSANVNNDEINFANISTSTNLPLENDVNGHRGKENNEDNSIDNHYTDENEDYRNAISLNTEPPIYPKSVDNGAEKSSELHDATRVPTTLVSNKVSLIKNNSNNNDINNAKINLGTTNLNIEKNEPPITSSIGSPNDKILNKNIAKNRAIGTSKRFDSHASSNIALHTNGNNTINSDLNITSDNLSDVTFDYDKSKNTVFADPTLSWISRELRDDVLLSALALQVSNVIQPNDSNSKFQQASDSNGAQTHNDNQLRTPKITTNLASTQNPDTTTSKVNQTLQSAIQSLFTSQSTAESEIEKIITTAIDSMHPSPIHLNSESLVASIPSNDLIQPNDIVPYAQDTSPKQINKSNISDQILFDSPNGDSYMPKTVMEVVSSNSLDEDITENIKARDLCFVVPRTGLLVHGLSRFLLNHFIDNVADLMIVVTVSKNPWKTLYFPRVLNTLGDLAGLGHSSYSRNSLLNAILALSCFNLLNKFPKTTKEHNFFLKLGIQFRLQACIFLKSCLQYTVNKEKYKDVLCALLAMSSIDVVWGTMTDCHYHLDICRKYIEARMKRKSKLSEKAKTLHRIFTFYKLIQDSTSLDKVRESEIDLQNKQLISDTVTTNENNQGTYLEEVHSITGQIYIRYIPENPTKQVESPASGSPPMFNRISKENYYFSKGNNNQPLEADILRIDCLYGLPNSLIMLFSECISLARHSEYFNLNKLSLPRNFNDLIIKFEKKLLKWKPEWNFFQEDNGIQDENGNRNFLNDTIEGVYHHTISFYNGLIIYFFTIIRNLNVEFLQNYVMKVISSLNKLNKLIELKNIKVLPLMWQGIIAGCACQSEDIQDQFREWAGQMAKNGMGSYWGARQVMYEVWRRRREALDGDDWYSVYKDWNINLMLF
ncbi:hypothetical protein TBLA_0G01130 [Henningerozyma blattae CBS 6284]|uniref:Zn(2)-C6 fungal-type domain-containing protein n=1 Tax=Henningerozyma blattae (strain ATCC 34711 / CBS 6284 / DSM 70876 / NBRC 10599 / NRRL Y-10934 / UCD 77-7) TaxID=1071380 RepID=I2H6Q7_HENB6|nr:hypothetical protein TBLA_0G01130 [Tetrapisispora blattae CBS 6284]CCH62059.1 hypothetical protein TBLA_0G01130 [Tetrapisispora blattae CBS 6284]